MKGIPDFCVQVYIENHPVQFYVYKRPHLDFFLTMVSSGCGYYCYCRCRCCCYYAIYYFQICQWYDLVIFTASMQVH